MFNTTVDVCAYSDSYIVELRYVAGAPSNNTSAVLSVPNRGTQIGLSVNLSPGISLMVSSNDMISKTMTITKSGQYYIDLTNAHYTYTTFTFRIICDNVGGGYAIASVFYV